VEPGQRIASMNALSAVCSPMVLHVLSQARQGTNPVLCLLPKLPCSTAQNDRIMLDRGQVEMPRLSGMFRLSVVTLAGVAPTLAIQPRAPARPSFIGNQLCRTQTRRSTILTPTGSVSIYDITLPEEIPSENTLRPTGTSLATSCAVTPQSAARQHGTNGYDGSITHFGWKAQNKSLVIFAGEAYNVDTSLDAGHESASAGNANPSTLRLGSNGRMAPGSFAFTLTVTDSNGTVSAGQSVSFSASFSGGTGAYISPWTVLGGRVEGGSHAGYDFLVGTTSSVFSFTDVAGRTFAVPTDPAQPIALVHGLEGSNSWGAPDADALYVAMAGTLLRIISVRREESVSLVAHSMGGLLARHLHLTVRRPGAAPEEIDLDSCLSPADGVLAYPCLSDHDVLSQERRAVAASPLVTTSHVLVPAHEDARSVPPPRFARMDATSVFPLRY
jgi:hypothetical protein